MATNSTTTATAPLAFPSSPYDRVEVLMLRWVDADDSSMLDQEMKLEGSFQRYGYGVTYFVLNGYGQPSRSNVSNSRVADVVMKWVRKVDRGQAQPKRTLLIVTYDGHADPRRLALGQGKRLFAQAPGSTEEEFDLSWVQLQCRQNVQHSDLYWLNDCCFAGVKGFDHGYQTGCPIMQMEMCGSGYEEVSMVDGDVSFFQRIARNMDGDMSAATVQERSRAVHSPGERAGEGMYRLDAGTPNRSIIIAPKRAPNGTITRLGSWGVDSVLNLDDHNCCPDSGLNWAQWIATPPSPPQGVDNGRLGGDA